MVSVTSIQSSTKPPNSPSTPVPEDIVPHSLQISISPPFNSIVGKLTKFPGFFSISELAALSFRFFSTLVKKSWRNVEYFNDSLWFLELLWDFLIFIAD